jgi:hypothetical protein
MEFVSMMGRNVKPQKPLFYSFNLDDLVPQDHLLRKINRFLDLSDFIAPQYERAWQMLLPHLVLTQPLEIEKLDLGVAQFVSLAPQETVCDSQEFLLSLFLLTDFYRSSVYNFEEWHRALTTAHELAEAEVR